MKATDEGEVRVILKQNFLTLLNMTKNVTNMTVKFSKIYIQTCNVL